MKPTLLASPAIATDSFTYDFPGCNPGSGTWPAQTCEQVRVTSVDVVDCFFD